MNSVDADFMRVALQVAQDGIRQGQTPFGCVIVLEGKIVATTHNTVWQASDPTAHAEVNALRAAALKCASIALIGGVVYSTCEPCPMCIAACHWARVARVVFGASIADAAAAGFNELTIAATQMVRLGRSSVLVEGGVLVEDCKQLFETWKRAGLGRSY